MSDREKGFIQARGNYLYLGESEERYIPLGCNYFEPDSGWPPKIWSRFKPEVIKTNFAKIADAGLNSLRIFLDTSTLSPERDVYSEEGFEKAHIMTELAAEAGLRIIYGGPNTLEKFPSYLAGTDIYSQQEEVDRTCRLWQEIMKQFGDNPTIMTWDLQNEPSVKWYNNENLDKKQSRLKAWQDFIADDSKITIRNEFPQLSADTDLYTWTQYIDFLESLADNWVKQQCDAIRSGGGEQLISVGLIQWSVPVLLPKGTGYSGFNPQRIAKYLDYITMHFYPILTHEDADIADEMDAQTEYLKNVVNGAFVSGKPLLLEEFGWKGGAGTASMGAQFPEKTQTLWCKHLVETTSNIATGWLNWGFVDSASEDADISKASGLWTTDYKMKHWGKEFAKFAKKVLQEQPECTAKETLQLQPSLAEYTHKKLQ